ncbi:MAG: Eco57I restriction-modification methylase domain-containing protein [Candidatus Heimdallarchaeaceae archaeon]
MVGPIAFVETPEPIVSLMVGLISNDKKSNVKTAVLDSGTGKGVFLEILQKAGYKDIMGVELDTDLYEYTSNKFSNLTIQHQDYLDWITNSKYDVIIGNPPYCHFNSLPRQMKIKVADTVGNKESDIYYAFIMKSIDLLKDGGELIYIVPYGFFFNTYAKVVREKIKQEGYLDIVIDLDETRIFDGENPETIIFKFVKTQQENKPQLKILRTKNRNLSPKKINAEALDVLSTHTSSSTFDYHEREMFSDESVIWTTYPEKKIYDFYLLKDVAWIGVGLVSGFEKAYTITEEEKTQLNENEKKLLLKCIKAKHCKGFWTEGFTEYVLIDNRISTEEELLEKYPYFYKKIVDYKESMRVRYLPENKKWFHWQALRNFEKLKVFKNQAKIFVPNLDRSTTNRFSMSLEPIYPSGDVLTIVPKDKNPYFLLGYLNSHFFRDYYLSAGARRGHRISFTQRIMANIKIPNFSETVEEKISKIAKEIFDGKKISLRTKINDLVLENIN